MIVLGAVFYFFLFDKNSSGSALQTVEDYLPFGKSTSVSAGNTETSDNASNQPVNIPVGTNSSSTDQSASARLREITSSPVAGFTVLGNGVIRYIDRATGNIYNTKARSSEIDRLTDTTISRIQEAFFTDNGSSTVLRWLGDNDAVKTTIGQILPPTASSSDEGSINGYYIDDNIDSVAISPDSQKIYSIFASANQSIGVLSDYKGDSQKNIFTSPLSQWTAYWINNNLIALTSKAASIAPGSLLTLNPKTGNTTSVLNNINGLTDLINPKADTALVSYATPNNLQLALDVVGTNSIENLAESTLPEKCVWSESTSTLAYCFVPNSIPSANYPDAWYQGIVSFNDSIYSIDASTGNMTKIYDPAGTDNDNIDAISPVISPDGNFLVFMNKKDGSLWSFDINQ